MKTPAKPSEKAVAKPKAATKAKTDTGAAAKPKKTAKAKRVLPKLSPVAVSYTHLDVYKRQLHCPVSLINKGLQGSKILSAYLKQKFILFWCLKNARLIPIQNLLF